LEALRAGATIHRLLLAEGQKRGGIIGEILSEAQRQGVHVEWLQRNALEKLVEAGANHQGVVAELPPFRYSSVDEILERAERKRTPPFILLLDGIQDVHNFGALLRTAEAAGMDGVIIPERRAVGVTPTVYKSSAGALHHLPIAQVTNLTRTIDELKAANIWIAGLDMTGEQLYHEANLTGPLAIVLGAEGSGLSRLVADHCDFLVHIPMLGKIDSLNASVAGAILIYDALRQRTQGRPSGS
jgi:23S rRNA (guanosine2251-2'-O)-methyltransferase